ncbi:MAG: glycoside hydrolase family 88 protein [Fidelibacterota bacterium]|nr:MAG: glycoside hydrolase family 88 protein [Candidatus Neomarinimicrobiota bacterium]
MRSIANHLLAIIIPLCFFACAKSGEAGIKGDGVFRDEGNSPVMIGRQVTADLLAREEYMMYISDHCTAVHYAEVCAGFGAARLAGVMRDSTTISKLSQRYRRVIDEGIVNTENHVDANVYGILPLELYLQTGDTIFFHQGIHLADVQWEDPRPDGLTNQTRFWIDDIWMIGSLQVQAYRATGNETYLERAAMEIDAYLRELQQPNGLFHHGQGAPYFWGRGNGWVAAGLAELLSELSANNAYYSSILDGYRKMMEALLRYQAEDGMWRQLIDHQEAWKETSSSAMFGYAMSVGVRKGLLTAPAYTKAYQKAWLALVEYLNDAGQMTEVCVGTGKGDSVQYYLDRPRTTGDLHGQAPMLWFAYSLLVNSKE